MILLISISKFTDAFICASAIGSFEAFLKS